MIDTSKRLSILYSAAWTCVIGSAVARVFLVTVGVVCCHGGCVLSWGLCVDRAEHQRDRCRWDERSSHTCPWWLWGLCVVMGVVCWQGWASKRPVSVGWAFKSHVSLVTVGVVCCHGGCVLTGLSIKETGVGGMSVDMSPISQTSPISMSPLSGSPLSAGVQATDGASDSVDPSVMLKIHSRRFRESVSSPVRCLRPGAVFTEHFHALLGWTFWLENAFVACTSQ